MNDLWDVLMVALIAGFLLWTMIQVDALKKDLARVEAQVSRIEAEFEEE